MRFSFINNYPYRTSIIVIVSSICLNIVSFYIGRFQNINHQNCDPFRLIREELPIPTPTISSLLKPLKNH